MEEQFIRDRISKLREEKQVSERKMSLDLGHSTSYIRSITSGRSLPSMSEFLYICEYLGVTPMEFFNEAKATTLIQQKAIDYIYSMSDADVSLMIEFIERMKAAKLSSIQFFKLLIKKGVIIAAVTGLDSQIEGTAINGNGGFVRRQVVQNPVNLVIVLFLRLFHGFQMILGRRHEGIVLYLFRS